MTEMSELRFRIGGLPGGEPSIEAESLSEFLNYLLKCLRRVEAETSPNVSVEYHIVDLRIGSAELAVQPRSLSDANRAAEAVAENFESGFHALQAGNIGKTAFRYRTQQCFVSLLKPLQRDAHIIEFKGRKRHVLERVSLGQAALQKTRTAECIGSVSGRIDAVNVHRKRVFYLYPASGTGRVTCAFEPKLLEQVLGAFERHATVHGTARYGPATAFPNTVDVERIEVHPSNESLPTLGDLYGTVPNLTAGVESASFVRAQRDAET